MPSIFTVTTDDLAVLSPEKAVELTAELLWADSQRVGLPISKINIPQNVDANDGGIDAVVEADEVSGGTGLIQPGRTSYQVKAGEFAFSSDSNVKELFFTEKNNLKPRIKAALDAGNKIIVVLTKCDDPERTDGKFKEKCIEILNKHKYSCEDINIEFVLPNQIVGFLHSFPSLALKITGRDNSKFFSLESWSRQAEMNKEYHKSDPLTTEIEHLREVIRANERAIHVRVRGEPGIGKTRFVLESLKQDDLAPTVIYVPSASQFIGSDLNDVIVRSDNNFEATLVIDECDESQMTTIWNQLAELGRRMRLITIHHEYDERSGVSYIDPPALSDEQITAIIEDYGVPNDRARIWTDECSGSPRVAHVIGLNLRENPDDLLKEPSTVKVWDKYIEQGDDPNSEEVKRRKRILGFISLFRKFGFGRAVLEEATAIYNLIRVGSPDLTRDQFDEAIQWSRRRKILQGEQTLYITPKALHIKLWIDWWDKHGENFQIQEFYDGLAGKLPAWFHDMFRYAASSPIATRIAQDLLKEDGPLHEDALLRTELGASFFLALSEGNPGAALHFLQRTIGAWSREELLEYQVGRRELVWALEKIVMWEEYFVEGARLILALADAENERWSNNATGVFAGLFTLGTGWVAPTELEPLKRFIVLKEALDSDSRSKRFAGLKGAENSLETHGFVKVVGSEKQGIGKQPKLWSPKKWKELFDAYRYIWNLLDEYLEKLPIDEAKEASKILVDASVEVGINPNMIDMVMDTLVKIIDKPYTNKEQIIDKISWFLRYRAKDKDITQEVIAKWKKLKSLIVRDDFHSRIERYVKMNMFQDLFDDEGNQTNDRETEIEKLAKESIANPENLSKEMHWLTTINAQNGYVFGYQLSKRDKEYSLLNEIIKSTKQSDPKERSIFFLGGYIRAIQESDPSKVEMIIDGLLIDADMKKYVPELLWRAEAINEKTALQILELAKDGVIGPANFRALYIGESAYKLPEAIFFEWVKYLLSTETVVGVEIAVSMYYMYYPGKKSGKALPEKSTLEFLTHPTFLLGLEKKGQERFSSAERGWTDIAEAYLEIYLKYGPQIAEFVIKGLGIDGCIFDNFYSDSKRILSLVAENNPNEMWQIVKKYLLPRDSQSFHLTRWLRGEKLTSVFEGGLGFIPMNEIWEWIDENPKERAWYVASFVPKVIFNDPNRPCLARELLIRYGTDVHVRSALSSNFGTDSWSGPASLHHLHRKEQFEKLKKEEDNPNVILWLNEQIQSLEEQVEADKVREEREF